MLLGQVAPTIIAKAAEAIGLGLDLIGFDPGESIRRQRLLTRRDWDAGRVERRIKRSNHGYEQLGEFGSRTLEQFGELNEYIKNYDAMTQARLELESDGMTRVPAKFVYDWSGPLSRRLEIEMDRADTAGTEKQE